MNSTKRIWLTIAGILLLIPLLLTVAGWLYRDKVKNLVVESLNERLTAKIQVDDISFSFISSFPYAEVEFRNVRIQENDDFKTTGTILTAERISLLMSLKSIFTGDYSLKKVEVDNAAFNLQTDKKGRVNYDIWKKDTTSATGQLSFELEQVTLTGTQVLYYNARAAQDITFFIDKGTLSGNFGADQYLLTSEGKLEKASVVLDGVSYLSNKDCTLRLGLGVEKSKGRYTFENSGIRLAGLDLDLSGLIMEDGDDLELDLKITSPGADLPSLLSLIPEKYQPDTKGYNYSGQMNFDGFIRGKSGKSATPLVNFNFTCSNVELNPKGSPYHLTKVNTKGFFSNKKSRANPVTYLRLEKFSALLEGKPVKADIEIENFSRPRLSIIASAELELEPLSQFFLPRPISRISGVMNVDARFNGIAGEKSTYKSSGDISFRNVAFAIEEKPLEFKNFSGVVHLDGNDVTVSDLKGQAGNSDFKMSGDFRNLFGWLFDEDQLLDIRASLSANRLDLNELMAKDTIVPQTDDTIFRLNFPEKLRFQLSLNSDQLVFRKFEASEIRGDIALEQKVLMTRQLDLKTAGGSVRLKGSIDDRPADSLRIQYDALVNNLDINKLFYEMGNFGQTVIVDKNLRGRVSAEIQFRSMWSDRLDINERSIYAKSDIVIENGELLNFDPLLALSRFVKGTDLKAVKFSTLSNTIEIRDRKIFIPLMEIKSNAMDIMASGEHTFDNAVNYKLRLYLSQILGRKVKEQNTEFGTIEDDGLGRPMLFLTMSGTASNPKFAWDRKSVEKKISEEIKSETKTLKNLLKEEFGRKDPEAPKKEEKKPKREELQIDYEDDGE